MGGRFEGMLATGQKSAIMGAILAFFAWEIRVLHGGLIPDDRQQPMPDKVETGSWEVVDDFWFRIDSEQRVVLWQVGAFDELLSSRIQPVGRLYSDVFPTPFCVLLQDAIRTAHESRSVREAEYKFTGSDGTPQCYQIRIKCIENGETIVLCRDITDVRRATEELQSSEDRYRSLVELALDGIAIIQDGKLAYINSAGVALMQAPSSDVLMGQRLNDFLHPDDVVESQLRQKSILEGGIDIPLHEVRIRRLDGNYVTVEVRACLCWLNERPAIQLIARDITTRRKSEGLLRRETEFRESIINTAAEGICVCVAIPEYPFVQFSVWNERMLQITGYTIEEINRLGWYQTLYTDPQVRERAIERMSRMRDGDDLRAEKWVLTRKDGDQRTVTISTSRFSLDDGKQAVVALLQDITERERAEEERRKLDEQMRHTQKLESLGVLAGGIAHDFNNILGAILGYAELILEDAPESSTIRPMVHEIVQAANRGAALTQQMLAYAGRGTFRLGVFSLDHLVREMYQLLQTVVSKKAIFEFDLRPATVTGDATQIQQVVMNLMTNASDALGGECGTILVRTGVRFVYASEFREHTPSVAMPDGQYAYLEVSDTGTGMSDETLQRIFDPFFTTKFVGRGLGLASVLGIVRSHNGTLNVSSTMGKGSSFRLWLPAVRPVRSTENVQLEPQANSANHGYVLVVDDEPAVRQVTSQMLTLAGFHVLQAEDGTVGFKLFREHQAKIEAVLVDLTMPRTDGLEMVRQLRQISSQIPVLVMSGYCESDVAQQFADLPATGFVQKPVAFRELIERLEKLIAISTRTRAASVETLPDSSWPQDGND